MANTRSSLTKHWPLQNRLIKIPRITVDFEGGSAIFANLIYFKELPDRLSSSNKGERQFC
jgi:hypothetical protein